MQIALFITARGGVVMNRNGHMIDEESMRRLNDAMGTMNLITLYGLLWKDNCSIGLGANSAAGLNHVTRTRGRSGIREQCR